MVCCRCLFYANFMPREKTTTVIPYSFGIEKHQAIANFDDPNPIHWSSSAGYCK